MEIIKDGTGRGFTARVGSDNRLWSYSIIEPIGSERSINGQLFGTGTGGVTLTGSESNSPMLWLRNDDPDNLFQVDKIIYGWNGGSTTWLKTCLCLITYQTAAPTANHTAATPTIENISRSGSDVAVTDTKATVYKWDGVGSAGMTAGAGGYVQIVNRISKGDTSLGFIAGQIILGQNDTMQLSVTPEEAGLFNAAIVYWKIPVGGRT